MAYHLINLWLTLQFLIEAETYSFQSLNHKVIRFDFQGAGSFIHNTHTHIFSSFTLNINQGINKDCSPVIEVLTFVVFVVLLYP